MSHPTTAASTEPRASAARRVTIGLIAAAGAAVAVAVAAWSILADHQQAMREIAENDMPAVTLTASIDRHAHVVAARAAYLAASDNDATRRGEALMMLDAFDAMDMLLAKLATREAHAAEADRLRIVKDRLFASFQTLDQRVARRFAVESLIVEQQLRLARLAEQLIQFERRQHAANDPADPLLRFSHAARGRLRPLRDLAGATQIFQIDQLAAQDAAAAPALNGVLAALPNDARATAKSWLSELEHAANGPSGLFPLSREAIGLKAAMQGSVTANRVAASEFVSAAAALALAAQNRVDAREAALSDRTRHSAALFAGLAALSAAAAAAVGLLVVRPTLRRLAELRQAMLDHMNGDRADIPVGGNDELGDMASALAYFVDQIDQRHTELLRSRDMADRARGEAEAANEAKSRFLTHLSHELRTPLNAVMGFAEAMRRQDLGPIGTPIYIEHAKLIHSAGEHLLDLVNDLLDLAKVEAGKMPLRLAAIDVVKLGRLSVRLLSDVAEERGVALRFDMPTPPPNLTADERIVRQMAINLLSNAVKFTPAGGSVVLSFAVLADGGLRMRVADTGVGMSADDIRVAMEPFGQVENALQREHRGAGLGLPLVKAFAELHGGTLTIESAPGAGAVIDVIFPPNPPRACAAQDEYGSNAAGPAPFATPPVAVDARKIPPAP